MKAALRGVMSATLTSLACLMLVPIVGAFEPVDPEAGDSWVRGIFGFFFALPFLALLLLAYFSVAALLVHFLPRGRGTDRRDLLLLAVTTAVSLTTWFGLRDPVGPYLLVGTILLIDLVIGTLVLIRTRSLAQA